MLTIGALAEAPGHAPRRLCRALTFSALMPTKPGEDDSTLWLLGVAFLIWPAFPLSLEEETDCSKSVISST